jgi:hypothetical protein
MVSPTSHTPRQGRENMMVSQANQPRPAPPVPYATSRASVASRMTQDSVEFLSRTSSLSTASLHHKPSLSGQSTSGYSSHSVSVKPSNLSLQSSIPTDARYSTLINFHPHQPARSNAAPTASSTKSKRSSRFAWMKRSSTSLSGSSNLPNISEPILEFSTSDLLPEYRYSTVAPSRDHLYSPDRMSRTLDDARSISRTSTASDATAGTAATAPSLEATIPVKSPQQEDEVKELQRKLKDSDDKRRTIMLEYQQKLDAERKKTLELQKKIDQLKLTKPKVVEESKSKIKVVESQRDLLRNALISLREAKDMEIGEYKSKLDRMNGYRYSDEVVGSTMTGTKRNSRKTISAPSSGKNSPKQGLPVPLRSGIRPLLPISRPVEMFNS